MLRRIVDFSLENRPLVLIAAVLMILGGGYALTQLPIDVQPDITNVQVQVLTKAPALGPVEMEQFITYPIEAAMNGLPRLHEIRSVSRYGLSAVTVVFEDGVDVYFARQLVNERLSQAREAIPPGLGSPEMGPVTTGLGDVFQFTVEGDGVSAMERRTILDWLIAPRLRAVPGVTEVNAWGGLPKQYQVVVDPAKLLAYRIALKDVFEAVETGTRNAGGGYIEHNREQYILRGEGLVESLADIEKIVLKAGRGRHAGDGRQRGAGPRGGDAPHRRRHDRRPGRDRDRPRPDAGRRERPRRWRPARARRSRSCSRRCPRESASSRTTTARVLVRRVIRTVETNLLEGALLVVAVLFAFLGNVRAGLIVASAIPLSMLLAFTGMVESRISANLMSLGRDRLRPDRGRGGGPGRERRPAARRAGGARQDGPAAHRRGRPRGGPADHVRDRHHHHRLPPDPHPRRHRGEDVQADGLDGGLRPGRVAPPDPHPHAGARLALPPEDRPRARAALRGPAPRALPARRSTPASRDRALVLVRRARGRRGGRPSRHAAGRRVHPAARRGRPLGRSPSARPRSASPRWPPAPAGSSASSSASRRSITVVSRSGSPELATDVMGIELGDVFVMLKPRSEWTTARTKGELVEKMSAALAESVPGIGFSFTQPIEMRFNELIAGVRSDVGVKLFGDDLDTLREKGEEIARVVAGVPGAADVKLEQTAGLPVIRVRVDRDRCARYGISVGDVLDTVEAARAGKVVGTVFEGQRRFSLVVRLDDEAARTLDALGNVPVASPSGASVPLGQLAEIALDTGPAQISREAVRRRIVVETNVRGRDVASFVAEARERLAREVQLPERLLHPLGRPVREPRRRRATACSSSCRWPSASSSRCSTSPSAP